jgi:separase
MELEIYRYALLCLMHVTTVADDTYWGQVTKVTKLYLKAQNDEVKTSKQIHELYSNLVHQTASSRPSATAASSFGTFCQAWLSFGQKTRNITVLDDIQRMITPLSREDEKNSVLSSARLLATIKQTATALEQTTQDGLRERLELAKQAVRQSNKLLQKGDSDPISRSLLNLRRICTVTLESSWLKDISLVRSLLSEILDLLQSNLFALPSLASSCSQLLDSLFVLSSVVLVPSDVKSHAESYGYLNRAVQIVSSDLASENLSTIERSNFLRCISSAAHNHAVKLYQDGRHAAAIKFLEDACTVAQQAMLLRSQTDVHDDDEKELKRWQSLEETMYRRWELLGVCFSRVGGRRQMFDSFVKSVISFPFDQSSFEGQVSTSSLSVTFASSPALQQLGVLIDRITILGVVELELNPATTSLFHFASTLSPSILGALLERQASALDEKLWKKAAPFFAHLLENLLDLYSPSEYPIRRSRVLLWGLQVAFHVGFENLSGLQEYSKIAEGIIQLCSLPNVGRDIELMCFTQQIMVTASLWVILHSYRADSSESEGLATIIQTCIENACVLLRTMSKGQSQNIAKVAQEKPRKPRIAKKTRSQRSTASKAIAVPASKEVPLPIEKKIFPKLDSGLKLLSLIESVSCLTGLLGLSLPNVHLLYSSVRVFEQQGHKEGPHF